MAVRLDHLEFELSRAFHPPAGGYQNAKRHADTLYVAGHGPLLDGTPRYRGKVPSDVSIDEGRAAARLAAINCLATIQHAIGSLDNVTGILRVLGMVNASADFDQHPRVIDGASALLLEVFGPEAGAHTRSAVGMASLPFGIPVELVMVLTVR